VKAELIFGARKSAKPEQNLARLARFFQPLVSLPFDDGAADHYGSIRTDLERAGTPIGANDLMIGAIALAHSLTLVTANQTEFSRIGGLVCENWEA
jgi:tRNA(fMet)-specific endonuclease VapC